MQPLHLLQGLLEEEEGRAAVLLTRSGADLVAIRQALAAMVAVSDLGEVAAAPLPFDPVSDDILNLAHDLAVNLSGDRVVASEFLLLALVRREESIRHLLEQHGFQLARLEQFFPTAHEPPLPLEVPLDLSRPTEQIDTARILDASANRAREALRVVEDYIRFVLDDVFLSRELKQMRHELAETLADLPPGLLLEARETQRDVGTRITTPGEQERSSLLAVVRANLKRLQEALRSLEEFGKLTATAGLFGSQGTRHFAPTMERLRYRSYTLERAIDLGTTARDRLEKARLMVLLSGSNCQAALDWTIQEAAAGGAAIIQLREKNLSDDRLLQRAREVRRWTRQAGVLFLINDRPDIARLVEADGVHLGQDDLPIKDARRILGPGALIGVSTHNLEQVRRAILDGASYVGVGPTFPSGTKEFTELAGLDFVRQVAAETSLPAFVVGGIHRDNIAEVVAAGARRVAVSQAIAQTDDPRSAAAVLLRALTSPEA